VRAGQGAVVACWAQVSGDRTRRLDVALASAHTAELTVDQNRSSGSLPGGAKPGSIGVKIPCTWHRVSLSTEVESRHEAMNRIILVLLGV
jgi:hypothetical protein